MKFFTGVPDSLLKNFCAYVSDNAENHIIAANEGGAVALAIGNYLATGGLPLVYLQNSGLGNCVNPLLSLADDEVYGIPMLLLIGWRGKPGVKDEPQHVKQGRVMLAMLDSMEIPYSIVPQDTDNLDEFVSDACKVAKEKNNPYALIVEKGTFDSYKLQSTVDNNYPLSRERAIELIASAIDDKDVIVSTTGFASRELFEVREKLGQGHEKDFLTVGGMGHTSHIAVGAALGADDRNIYCIDGDGSVLMHMGSMAINAVHGGKNFKHIVINNGMHHSVGGQETVGFNISLQEIAKACGYEGVDLAHDESQLIEALKYAKNNNSSLFLEVRVNKEARENLGRPTKTPAENKKALMEFF